MKKSVLLGLCALTILFGCSGHASAAFNSIPELPVLVNEADVICVAKITSVQSLDRIKIEIVHKDWNGKPVTIDAQNAIADVVVESVLKGKLESTSFQVAFFKNVHLRTNPAPFTELVAGENDILFLTIDKSKAGFSLTEPSSHGRSKICIGTVAAKQALEISPLRNVLSVLSEALTDPDKSVKLNCLQQIHSVGVILLLPINPSGLDFNQTGAIQLRQALNEPSQPSLEDFIGRQILPSVINLTKDPDDDVSEMAFIAAGRLQDVAVIPDLVRIAQKNYNPNFIGYAADTLGYYRTAEAFKPLIPLLKSSNHYVRERAAYAIRELRNPIAIPFLIDCLDDPDPGVLSLVETGLYIMTGEDPPISGTPNDGPIIWTPFWKKWALTHQDKLTKLRNQFKSMSPTNPVGDNDGSVKAKS